MAIDVQHCWKCGARLGDLTEQLPFHCSEKCQKECELWNYVPRDAWADPPSPPKPLSPPEVEKKKKKRALPIPPKEQEVAPTEQKDPGAPSTSGSICWKRPSLSS